MITTEGYVYLLSTEEHQKYKIGVSKNELNERIRQLSTGSFDKIYLIDYYKSKNYKKIEWFLHAKFNSDRLNGEWFDLELNDVKHFKDYCKEFDNTIDYLKENNEFYN